MQLQRLTAERSRQVQLLPPETGGSVTDRKRKQLKRGSRMMSYIPSTQAAGRGMAVWSRAGPISWNAQPKQNMEHWTVSRSQDVFVCPVINVTCTCLLQLATRPCQPHNRACWYNALGHISSVRRSKQISEDARHELEVSPPPPQKFAQPLHRKTDWSRLKNQNVNCAEIFKLWSFVQSKSVNDVCKLLQFLGDFVPQTPLLGLRPRTSLGDFRPSDPRATAPNEWTLLASVASLGMEHWGTCPLKFANARKFCSRSNYGCA